MIQLRNYFVLLFILSTSHFIFGQSETQSNGTEIILQKKIDSLQFIYNYNKQTIEKLKAELRQVYEEKPHTKNATETTHPDDCASKLTEKDEIIKKQRNEIEKLHQKIELLETKLGIKPKNKEPKPEIEKEPKPVIPKPILTTVTIGSQTWMTTNLNVTTFRNGDPIYEAQSVEEWERCGKKKIPAWCWYDNDPKTDKKTGKLYNWFAINDPRDLTPSGYHIPNESDWNTLVNHLGGELDAAPKMRLGKEWGDSTTVVHSNANFAAVPSGWRLTSPDGTAFTSEGAYWWSATQLSLKFAWTRYVVFFSREVKSYCYPKSSGLAVRCIKD